MTTVHVFDPAMCCSTGICGPSVDPQLVRFAADLDWLKRQGVSVERFNLAQQPAAFAADAAVKSALVARGEGGLPLVKVNGDVKSSGTYPTRDELAAWAGLGAQAPSLFTDAVAELVAIGAAIASNCETCFKFHYDKARKLGVSREDMMRAVSTARAVKDSREKAMQDLAHRFLEMGTAEARSTGLQLAPQEASSACCEPSKDSGDSAPRKSTCC